MANTYSQIYIHVVFAVQYRENLLKLPWRKEVFKYISGIITNKGLKPIIVNGVEDHVHILFELKPSIRLSDVVREIKNHSTIFINKQNWLKTKFGWQVGYGAFSYSFSQVNNVYNYIYNQEKIHSNKTFQQEYLDLLKKFEIEYSDKYLFEWME